MILASYYIIEPVGAIVAFIVFGSWSCCYLKLLRSRAALWGETRQEKERLRIKSAQQGFGGIKDIKLYGTRKYLSRSVLKRDAYLLGGWTETNNSTKRTENIS